MKKRNGFVSNSSSSSFVCEVCCSTSVSIYDGCNIEEYGFHRCINEHIICSNCFEEENPRIYSEDYGSELISDKDCPICKFEIIGDRDLEEYLKIKYNILEQEVLDYIKSINKRRQRIYTRNYITYVLNKFKVQELDIISEIKSTFKNYKKFNNYLRSNYAS